VPGRPAAKFPLLIGLNIVLLLVLSASPAKATKSAARSNAYYLPVVRVEWEPPCGGVPFLISPPDGSDFDSTFKMVLDGGYRAGSNDWLEVEVSGSPDFENSIKRYYQPAGKRWEFPFWIYFYGTTRWHWRALVWCQGPGGTLPPAGYLHSAYSQVWSFTIDFHPYPPP
jgi:hypothetical protein